jgi:hypothetical protein
MGWEQRGTFQYFYKKEREGSRVKSIYVGRGDLAQLSAKFCAMQQDECRLMNQKLGREQGLLEAFDSVNLEMERAVKTITEAALIAAGFHQHKRQWRKRRT